MKLPHIDTSYAGAVAVTLPSKLTFKSPSITKLYRKAPHLASTIWYKFSHLRNCYCEINVKGKPRQESNVFKTCMLGEKEKEKDEGNIDTNQLVEL